jgi:hypothetical protein
MHDNFFGQMQPENRIIFDLAQREKPDVIMNMHTGVPRNDYFINVLTPSGAFPKMQLKVWKDFYTYVHTALTLKGLKKTMDPAKETMKKPVVGSGSINLTTALTLHCGALTVTVEDGSHGYTGVYSDGTPVEHTPLKILKSQLTAHHSAMQFLYRKGGISKWEIEYK